MTNKTQKKSTEIVWQRNLDNLGEENSAENYFITKIKKNHDHHLLDAAHDFYVSPFSDEEIQAHDEGQLSLDVFQTADAIVVKAAIAGINPDELEIVMENDILTIRGERRNDDEKAAIDYLYQECYWGKFSRSIIIPTDVDSQNIVASINNGILRIIMPMIETDHSVKITVHETED
jgi:HSP20 family protein